jgi:predicted DNA-binding protein (MmcQ/YjbR family)
VKNLVPFIEQHCSGKKDATESYPWKYKKTLGYKVSGKLFAARDEDAVPVRLNVRCTPDRAQSLKVQYKAIDDHPIHPDTWVSISLDSSIDEPILREVIDNSYLLAIKTLKKSERDKYL